MFSFKDLKARGYYMTFIANNDEIGTYPMMFDPLKLVTNESKYYEEYMESFQSMTEIDPSELKDWVIYDTHFYTESVGDSYLGLNYKTGQAAMVTDDNDDGAKIYDELELNGVVSKFGTIYFWESLRLIEEEKKGGE